MSRFFTLLICLFFTLLAIPLSAQQEGLRKMSPMVRAKLYKAKSPLFVFVKTSDDVSDLYDENYCEVFATFGDIQIVQIPRENLYNIACDERVKRIEMGRRNVVSNAVTTGIINAAMVHDGVQLPQAYTGKGVVVGIQDIGFDLTNPNFYSRDMAEYRIKALWDMLSTDTIGSSMPVGNEYCDEVSLLSYAHSRDGLICNHGSHTLGTAAGSGFNSAYSGIAFDSDICLVSNVVTDNQELLSDFDDEEYGSALTALGFKYIFDYADKVGKPCVISFSEGSYQGFEEEDLLYFEVLERLVGEGRIIVSSAGNNSQDACYIHKPIGQERAGSFMMKYGTQLYFMEQGTDDFTTRVTIYGTESLSFDIETSFLREKIDSIMCDTVFVDSREYVLQYVAYPSCYDEENIVVECFLSGPHRIGYDDVAPISVEVLGESTDIEVYSLLGNFVTNTLDPTLCDAEISHNVHSPSAAPAVISVGATAYVTGYTNMQGDNMTYNYGEGGIRADFSSIGPTIDNRIKPDVVAPGTNIVSSTNSFFFEANPTSSQWSDLVSAYEYNDRTYYWKADTGTSMSSPFVGGAIALWLEAKPDLTREEIIEVFAETCTHPDESLSYPNNFYGYGQIDVYHGLLKVLGIDDIKEISPKQPKGVRFKVCDNGIIVITFDEPLTRNAEIKIYALSGQLLQTTSATTGMTTVTIPIRANSCDIVAVQVNGDKTYTTGSTLLRIQ